ncbi:MAG: ABC transporter ATP-binding protein [Propionibacteriaceae bacterium]|uniref:Adenosinetriphosphatase n=1 Tax=Propionibacterium ruminifibrarum TaxID=1962131 RepID=A0A375I5U8_9ACTN|nr:ABC transporter ATP-binding protein [Propionibacterium ruminifibrarum]MBE6478362.1 ABC transporter ATP-binding protein [Propionibacteriaceae bacterium]SPF68847.1 adenosinetriphosphatase [Propionibacterium ruminifibrarum]
MTDAATARSPHLPAQSSPAVLRARNLSKHYGDARVLDGLDLDIDRGQFVAVMGPSGSGKSTFLHCLSGMTRPSGGSVLLRDTDLTALDERALAALRLEHFGLVFQQPHFMSTLCLLDNVLLPGFLSRRRPREEVTARGRMLLERMGIADLADADVTEVSGGQLQRAGICRALINEAAVLFADEPTGALNSATAARILDVFGEIHVRGTTIVMVTHDAKVALRADRVLVLVDGGVEEDLLLGHYREDQSAERLVRVSAALNRQSV